MINVVHLQKSSDSAGRAALRLHNALLEANVNSVILTLRSGINDSEKIIQIGRKSKIIAWVSNKLQSWITRNNYKQFGMYSYPLLGTNISKNVHIKNADVIYLHWVQGGFLSLSNIEQLARLGKPIIFFMHDMWDLTGGCHYSFTCDKFKINCNHCQMFPENKFIDFPRLQFDRKLKLYSKFNNLHFVSPSEWLYNCAKDAFVTKNKPVFYIPNIINTDTFKPTDKKLARNILNIDPNEIVIAFGATSVDNPYKGWTYLKKALEILKKNYSSDNISILVFGSGYNKSVADGIPFKVRFMGFLADEYSTCLVYNAADVFIAPSLAETFGYVILESLACGTPVVGFEVGGIPDLIKHKVNGYLARYKDSEDLANGIRECLDKKIKGSMLPIFEKDRIIKSHIDLINRIKH
jgi:glycosyltransferase involved in cell wall biosynthesis